MTYTALFPLVLLFGWSAAAQELADHSSDRRIPQNIRFSGTISGLQPAQPTAVRFALYDSQVGGVALWQETQNVQLDAAERFTVLLGATQPLPEEIFAANEARWLGIQVLADAEPEQPRVMLVSVPYALKAQDADTLGGLPASAFLRANAGTGGLTSASGSRKSSGQAAALELEGPVSADPHTTNAIPKFTSTTDTLADSMMFELYDQVAVDAVGHGLANEDVVKLGDGTGRKKRFEVDGRLVGQGFDMVTTLPNAVHAVSTYVDGVGMQANADGIGFSSGITGTSRGLNGAGVVGFALPPLSLQPQAPGDYALGVLATNYHPQGAALEAFNAYDGTALGADFPVVSGNIGVYSGTAHSSAIPLVLEQLASSGPILSARAQGTEVASMNSAGDLTTSGSITATGTITTAGTISASSFSGSGAGLTGVSASTAASATDSSQLGGVFASNYARLDVGNTFNGSQSVNGASGPGVIATNTAVDGFNSAAVSGINSAVTSGVGVFGQANSPSGTGVLGYAAHTSGVNFGVWGSTESPSGIGVRGTASGANARAIYGFSDQGGVGVYGESSDSIGVRGVGFFSGAVGGQFENTEGLILRGLGYGLVEKFSLDHLGNAGFGGTVTAAAFVGDGSGLTGVTGSATDVNCSGCVDAGDAAASLATQAELDAHVASGDHDGRYARLAATNTFLADQTVTGKVTATTGEFALTSSSSPNQTVLVSRTTSGGTALKVDHSGGDGPAIAATANTANNAAIVGLSSVNSGIGIKGSVDSISDGIAVLGYAGSGSGGSIAGVFAALSDQQLLSGRRSGFPGQEVFRVNGYGNVGLVGPYPTLNLITLGGDKAAALQVLSSGPRLQFDDSGNFALQVLPYASLLSPENQSGTDVFTVAANGNTTIAGSVTATSFIGNGSGLTGVSSTIADGSVTIAKLAFDPATQAELDAHKASSDHDSRYVLKAGDTMAGALNLPADGLTAGSDQLVLASGNVGIGSATPNMKLRIDNPADQGGLYLAQTNTSSSQNALEVYATGTATQNALSVGGRVGGAEPYINGLVVKTDGSVGIGTSTPTGHKLDVAGTIRAERLYGTSGGKLILIGYDNGLGSGNGIEFNAVEQGFDFQTHSGSWGSRMVITDAGDVGISTTSPSQRLHVVGNGLFSGSVTAASFSGSGSGLTGVSAGDVACVGCVAASELGFDPATQAELDTHKSSSDHDTRYALKAGDTITGALTVNGIVESTSGGFKFPDGSAQTTALSVASVVNPNRVALLRWYEANTVGINVAAGTTPIGVAFDGENMWVANLGSNNVTKIRASDGSVQGTFAIAGGPYGIAYDGATLWVTNRSSNNVTKVRPSDGANLGTVAVGTGPQGIAFDGANLWIANRDSNNVTKIRASDGANLGTFTVGTAPQAVAFDGTYIWVVNEFDGTISKLDSAGSVVDTIAIGALAFGVAFDGTNVWVTSTGAANVKKLRASDGALQGTFALGASPNGLAFDGSSIWVALQNSTVKKLRASDGAVLGTYSIGGVGRDVAFDGANVWITNQSAASVSKR